MNLFNMAKDLKGMEKMMKPALEKFMKDSGFVKKEELTKLENRIKELEDRHKGKIPYDDGYKHHSVWDTKSFLELCKYLNFNVVDYMDVDDKVGNGFTVVIKL